MPAVARALAISAATGRTWLKRFNAEGVAGLADAPRSGRPPTYTLDEIGAVIAAGLTQPGALGLPFGSWTLDRLTAYWAAVARATAYWNAHRHPVVWGRRKRRRPARPAGLARLPLAA